MIHRFEEFTSQVTLAYKYILKIKAQEMIEYGLKGSNVACLLFLGKNSDGLTAVELCDKCMEDKAGVSKSLAVLKEKGYVSQEDGKKYKARYFVTDAGKKVVSDINDKINRVVQKAGEGLSNQERAIFYTAFEKIVSNLAQMC
ncbi:MAG: MarR family winged helix-turn-helix transcriptional regulator [Clostridia bacterium]